LDVNDLFEILIDRVGDNLGWEKWSGEALFKMGRESVVMWWDGGNVILSNEIDRIGRGMTKRKSKRCFSFSDPELLKKIDEWCAYVLVEAKP
jgi:hypothetical protein